MLGEESERANERESRVKYTKMGENLILIKSRNIRILIRGRRRKQNGEKKLC